MIHYCKQNNVSWQLLGCSLTCSLWKSDDKKWEIIELQTKTDKHQILKEARPSTVCHNLSKELNTLLWTRSTHGLAYVWPRAIADIEGCFFRKIPADIVSVANPLKTSPANPSTAKVLDLDSSNEEQAVVKSDDDCDSRALVRMLNHLPRLK